ncbi:MAG: oxidoreductase, partial [Leptospirales bacterium]
MKSLTGEYIGNVWVKNRIAMAPMISNLANPDGMTNNNHIAYLEERAKGGFGLIITEYSYVLMETAKGSRNEMVIGVSDHIPKLKRLTESVHKHQSRIFVQIVHAGGKALSNDGGRIIAPSSLDYLGHIPSEMSEDDMEHTRKAFEAASRVSRLSNFDGIEIHGAHGYLIQEFLSPALNKRNDKYGGTFEKRLTFPQEIIDIAKESSGLPVGIRLSLYEDDPDGYDAQYGLRISESLKNLDYVHYSAGRFAPPGSSASFYSDEMHILKRLPRKPRIKSMIVGSITSPESIEEALKTVDFVALGRAALADPFIPMKLENGKVTIRPCIRCNQACRDLSYGEVRCTVNPYTGYENSRIVFTGLKGEITIAGGGVAGMEAALRARETGLKPIIYEKGEELGGDLAMVKDPFKKPEFTRLLDYYLHEIRRLGIEVILSTENMNPHILAIPPVIYPDLPDSGDISVDSNIYKHHDQM